MSGDLPLSKTSPSKEDAAVAEQALAPGSVVGNLPKSSSGLNNSQRSPVITDNCDGAASIVSSKYFIAEDWTGLIEQHDARLCPRCQAFSQRLPQIVAKLRRKKSESCEELRATWGSLKVSAKSGCPLCGMILMVMSHYLSKERVTTEPASFDCGNWRQNIYLRCKIKAPPRNLLKIEPGTLAESRK